MFSADKTLIATGGTAIVPPSVPGAELGTTSDGFFALEKQPKKLPLSVLVTLGLNYQGFSVVLVQKPISLSEETLF